jgi:hypothetical protein
MVKVRLWLTRVVLTVLAVAAVSAAGRTVASAAEAPPQVTGGEANNEPARSSADGTAPAARRKREFNVVPLVGGDSDIGVGVGQMSSLARLDPGPDLYDWRLESTAFITFKTRDGGLIIPRQDYFLLYSVREVGPGQRWRVDLRASFTRETTLGFFGLGNASPEPGPAVSDNDTEYTRTHPTAFARAQVRMLGPLRLHLGAVYTHNWLNVPPGSLLAGTAASGSPVERSLIGGFGTHGVALGELGLVYDSRDNEIVTRRGGYHTLTARASPSLGDALPYRYGQLNAAARFYVAPFSPRLTLAWRVVADVLVGDVPFYELERFEETSAIGGVKGLRGVPAQRYYGKVKLFQNLEGRGEVWDFKVRRKAFVLAVALFFDAGRVWTELGRAHPELDGKGLGLKYGVGGGLRLQQGETFVARADLAWSPDARPIAAYFGAGQIF